MSADLADLAARQLGLITRAQARAHSHSPKMIRSRLRGGQWRVVAPDVFAMAGTPLIWRTRVLAACLATGGVASHRSAAVLHGVDRFRPGRVEVTAGRDTSGSQVTLPGMTVHRSRDLHLARIVTVDSVPTTDAARLAVDLGAVVPGWRLEGAVDDLVGRRLLTWEDSLVALLAHARRGRNGVGPLRALLGARAGTEVPESALERAFVRVLDERGLPPPALQHDIFDGAGFVARVDAAYVPERVAIELDGLRWHLPAATFEADHRKRARLTAAGWTVLAFTWSMVMNDPGGVVGTVRSVLGCQSAQNGHSGSPERRLTG